MSTATATVPSPVLIIFNLHTHEAALARALRETNAIIHGGSALCWYTNSIPTWGQDIDIWCQPTLTMTEADIVARINAALTPAGYTNRNPATSCICAGGEICELCLRAQYLQMGSTNFIAVHEWTRHWSSTETRNIQLIIRRPLIPTSPVAEFDLDIATLCVAPHPTEDRLIVTEPDAALADRIRRRVMRIGNLRGQLLDNKKERVTKYYARGFAFESPTDGRRLTLEEAKEFIEAQWIAANPLLESDPHRADNLRRTLEALPLTQATPIHTLYQHDGECGAALKQPQNQATYPADTQWIKEYRDTLNSYIQTRKFVEDWDTAPITHVTNHEWIQRHLCRWDRLPAPCPEVDRVNREALHILAGGKPDDRIRPAVPVPPKIVKKVVKKA
jgi:hypothetical protein